jgi:ankyrin repeat protein
LRCVEELFDGIRAGDLGAVERALDAAPGAASSRGPDGVSAVLTARYRGHHEIVEALIRAGCDLDVFDAAALGRLGHLDLMLSLDPALATAWASDGFYPLALAAFFGQHAAVQRLLATGAGVQINEPSRNPMRVATIHAAVASRSLEVVKTVIDAGADVNARQQGGFTALHEAVHNGSHEIEALLLACGADPDALDAEGRRPEQLRPA